MASAAPRTTWKSQCEYQLLASPQNSSVFIMRRRDRLVFKACPDLETALAIVNRLADADFRTMKLQRPEDLPGPIKFLDENTYREWKKEAVNER
jgi:hypothetical protein